MKQRKPRDINSYLPAKDAAEFLREWADRVQRKPGLVKVKVDLWFYLPEEGESDGRHG